MAYEGTFSNYAEAALLNNFFKGAAYTPATTTYLALYTSNPQETDVGVEISVTGTGYARQAITWGTVTTDSGYIAIKNSADINYSAATIDWGLITHFGIRDASTGGNLLAYGPVEVSANITAGNEYSILANNMIIRLPGTYYSNYMATAFLNMLFKNTALTPTTTYAALYLATPGGADTGTEVSTGGYLRQAITWGTLAQDTESRAQISNSAQITFPVASVGYGPVTHIAIKDASSSGHLLCYIESNKPTTSVSASEQYIIKVSELILRLK